MYDNADNAVVYSKLKMTTVLKEKLKYNWTKNIAGEKAAFNLQEKYKLNYLLLKLNILVDPKCIL